MKKLNKKGFTLVELLAVIVLLAIIAVIAYTIIGNTINNSKKNAWNINVKNIKKAVATKLAIHELDSSNPSPDCTDTNTCANKYGTDPADYTTFKVDSEGNISIAPSDKNFKGSAYYIYVKEGSQITYNLEDEIDFDITSKIISSGKNDNCTSASACGTVYSTSGVSAINYDSSEKKYEVSKTSGKKFTIKENQ